MNNQGKIWMLAATFLVVAPLSISGTASTAMKILRIFSTVLIYYYAFMAVQLPARLNGAKALFSFSVLFTVAAVWSDALVNGLINKGMYFLVVCSGLAMAYSVESAKDLLNRLTLLGYTGGISSLSLVYLYIQNPEDNVVGDRLSAGGMNANTIGQSAAPLFLLSIFLIFKPATKRQKMIHLSSSILLLAIILGTGSRGALLMAAMGALFILKPILKKNFFAGAIIVMIPLVVFQMFKAVGTSGEVSTPGISRFSTEDKRNTRADMWNWTLKRWNESPLYGKGWLHWGSSSANTHSIYLHVLAECGIIGAAVFGFTLIRIFLVYRESVAASKAGMDPHDFTYFAAGILASMLLHGLVESSTLLGTSTNALFMGFSVGLLDRATLLSQDGSEEAPPREDHLHPWAFQRQEQPPEPSA